METRRLEGLLLALVALGLAGISPNLFPLAQAGYAKMSTTVPDLLVPAVVLLAVVVIVARTRGHATLSGRILKGAAAGLIATVALEAVRITSFHLGGMPGDMPRLLGVLITDRFMAGPSHASDVLGYLYHFWNGASFGIIYAILLGGRSVRWAVGYALLIGVGFLLSPAVKSMGVGFMASHMPAMQLTVVVAHLAFGTVLGVLARRWIRRAGA